MLIDAFLYAGEADMLELRLRTLDHAVDQFVAVEATVTHQGQPRKITLDTADARWTPWRGRLHLHVVSDCPTIEGRGGAGSGDYQRIERWHRDGILGAVDDLRPPSGAVVLISDVDEIPNPHRLDTLLLLDRIQSGLGLVFEQRFHSTSLDLLHPQQPWLGTVACRLRDLRPQDMRDARGTLHSSGHIVRDGGWHLSWFGTDEERQQKLDTFSHAELRDTFDVIEARSRREHANGEALRQLSIAEVARMDWPGPMTLGTFIVPDSWWSM